MEKKINIAELLKDCPSGMELDCTMFENVIFEGIKQGEYPIIVKIKEPSMLLSLTETGCWNLYNSAKCVIFPKGKTTWEGFVPPCQSEDGKIFATNNGLIIGIIKVKNNRQVGAYCSIDYSGDFRINSDYWFERMATYEEKEKLFNAIKANGYKWNEETKTLEKLPKFKVDDKIKLKGGDEFGIITQVTDCFFTIKCRNNTHCWPIKKQDDWELVPNKFDINTLKPYDKVLVRDSDKGMWCASIFSHTWKDKYFCVGAWYNQCIPYEANKELLGTTNNPE